jgi:cytoskeletal protein RodZ
MFKFLRKIKGQSTLEYAVLIIIVIGALLTIQVYIKRGVQGRLKSATDDIGDQYSPGNTNIRKTVSVQSTTSETFNSGVSTSTLIGEETTTTLMNSVIINAEQEFWGG